jgi:hypothetical protein
VGGAVMNWFARRELNKIIRQLSPAAKVEIASMQASDLILLHHGLGTAIRNKFRHNRAIFLFRWAQKRVPKGTRHIDEFTTPVIEEIWKTLRAMPEYKDLEAVKRGSMKEE